MPKKSSESGPSSVGADQTPRGAIVESIARTLEDRIRTGQYAPGERLVEAELSRELGVSRGPIREALRRLSAEGVLELEPHRGASVHRLGSEDMVDLLAVLEALTRLSLRLVAEQAREPEIQRRLRESLKKTRDFRASSGVDDVIACMAENGRFHGELAEISGNRLLARLMNRLQLHVYRLGAHGMISHEERLAWTEGHEEILGFLLAGDAPSADRTMQSFVRRVRFLMSDLRS